jgi:hypothetical protein
MVNLRNNLIFIRYYVLSSQISGLEMYFPVYRKKEMGFGGHIYFY